MLPISSISELDSLQNTLNSAIDTIREELKKGGFPDLSTLEPVAHPFDVASELPPPKFYDAQNTALAALGRLEVLLQNPYKRITQHIYCVYEAASLDAAVRLGIVDALLEAPDIRRGVHVDDLESKLDVDAAKLRIILRLLATKGWFHETSEGVFAVTRPTLQLGRGKNGWKAIQTPGKPQIAENLLNMLIHPQWKYSQSSKETAYQLAYKTNLAIFDHIYTHKLDTAKLFANSVKSLGDEFTPGLLEDFPWSQLDGKTIVDVGGGQGSLVLLLTPKMPNSTFIVQDLSRPLELARKNFEIILPEMWNSGKIKIEEHNFFDPQVQHGSDKVFILKWVLHDWPEIESIKILSEIARGGGRGAKLLIIEFTVRPGTITSLESLSVSDGESVPPFIPADYGQVSTIIHDMSVHLMSAFNGRERTVTEYDRLLNAAGMKMIKIWNLRSPLSLIEAEVL